MSDEAVRRHQPLRTCVACRRTRPKGELVRIARTPDGPRLDRPGTAPGRGAYVCPERNCVGGALRGGGVGRALGAPLGEDEAARLETMVVEGRT